MIPWIIISIAVLIATIAILAIIVRQNTKRKHRKIDYYAWFTIGIIWLAAGIPLKNYGLSAMGLIFMIIGLANKSKWKSNRVRWSDLDKNERKVRLSVMVVLGALVLAGIVVFFFAR